jgi:hypothetical protein
MLSLVRSIVINALYDTIESLGLRLIVPTARAVC